MADSIQEELKKLLDELDGDELQNLSEEKVLEMRKKLNPYGRTIEGSDKYLNFSITQIKHEYWKKLIISGFVGFLNRMNDEWKVPEGVPVTPVYDYLEDNTKVDTPAAILEKGYQRTIDDYEFNRRWMEKRLVVKEFLEEMFQFNPEEHVRSAYRPCRGDPERNPIETAAGKLAVDHHKASDKEFAANEELFDQEGNKYTMVKKKKVIKGVNGAPDKVIFKKVKVYDNVVDYSVKGPDGTVAVSKKVGDGPDPTLPQTVREFLPPHDIYGRFKSYYEGNYEQLRDFVKDAYCVKPDFELAINPYSVHDTEEEAEAFKRKHRNEVIAEVFTAVCGKWCFFDCFKEQRDNVNFYNDNTTILEEMMKQNQKDEELGRDLMKKRVKKLKQKNVIEDGPDAEAFKKWASENKSLTKMGAEYIGDMADDDIPDDAIQVDVWKVAKGGLELTKDKFYSSADASTVVPDEDSKKMLEESLKK